MCIANLSPAVGDPVKVAKAGIEFAKQKVHNFVIVDTAGRLHNKNDLMAELGKIRRVVEKTLPVSEVLLVIDATTGQNGLNQAKEFSSALDGLTGIILTKLDGTAKGGVIFAIADQFKLPLCFLAG